MEYRCCTTVELTVECGGEFIVTYWNIVAIMLVGLDGSRVVVEPLIISMVCLFFKVFDLVSIQDLFPVDLILETHWTLIWVLTPT